MCLHSLGQQLLNEAAFGVLQCPERGPQGLRPAGAETGRGRKEDVLVILDLGKGEGKISVSKCPTLSL